MSYMAAPLSGKFGEKAAWLRLNVLAYNLLTALKRPTLPADLRTAWPKQLRFLLLLSRSSPMPGGLLAAFGEPPPCFTASGSMED